jgi:hypothetical protein
MRLFVWLPLMAALLAEVGAAGLCLLFLLSLGGSAQLKSVFDPDSGLHSVVTLNDVDEPIQLGQFGRLLAANHRPALFQIREGSIREPYLNSAARACARLNHQVIGDSLKLFGERETRLVRMSESRPALPIERLSDWLSAAPFGQIKTSEFIIGQFALQLDDQVGKVLARPANQIHRTRVRQFIYALRDGRPQFSFQIADNHSLPHIGSCILINPLDRHLHALVAICHNHGLMVAQQHPQDNRPAAPTGPRTASLPRVTKQKEAI